MKLWIHIADVAAHVRPGSVLEKEAYRRATSTYVPGSVEPMLPFALSSSACSLAPGVERLAVTAEMELSEGGEVRSASFYRSTIRSDVRLDYEQLDELFAGRGVGARGRRRADRARAKGRLGAGREARRLLARGQELRARVRVRRRRARCRRARGRADRVSRADRAVDGADQRAGRPAARAQARSDALPRPRAARSRARRATDRPVRRARHPGAPACRRTSARVRRAASSSRPAGRRPARPNGAATAARRIHRSCSGP